MEELLVRCESCGQVFDKGVVECDSCPKGVVSVSKVFIKSGSCMECGCAIDERFGGYVEFFPEENHWEVICGWCDIKALVESYKAPKQDKD